VGSEEPESSKSSAPPSLAVSLCFSHVCPRLFGGLSVRLRATASFRHAQIEKVREFSRRIGELVELRTKAAIER